MGAPSTSDYGILQAGQEDYNRLRPLSYRCLPARFFSHQQSKQATRMSLRSGSLSYGTIYAPGVPIILVGTKLDLRDDKQFFVDHPGTVPISTAQGEELKKVIGATAYIECSSKTQQNIKAVFDAAIKVVLQPSKQKGKKRKSQKGCRIL